MKQASSAFLVLVYLIYSGECQILLPPQVTEMGWILFPDGDGKPHVINLHQTEVGLASVAVDPNTDVTFQLYTRSHPDTYTTLKPAKDADIGDFKNQRKTNFIIHGWKSNGSNVADIRKAYLEAGDYNVIVVDWSKPASGLYVRAIKNMRVCGEYLASLIDSLVTYHDLRLDDVHIVGHSLGAHMAGITGNRTKTGKPGRITGLDPAAPLFEDEDLANRLDFTDGEFVQVIHTCGGLLGLDDPLGHVDFYPNGGIAIQPGCHWDYGGSCSHSRSREYFAESITSTAGFATQECSNWDDYQNKKCSRNPKLIMGEFTVNRGSYYLRTAASPPYALGGTSTLVDYSEETGNHVDN